MELLKFLLNYFLEGESDGQKNPMSMLTNIIGALKNNNLTNVFSNLNLESLAPLASLFDNKKDSNQTQNGVFLEPIIDIADKEIVYSLNKFFANAN